MGVNIKDFVIALVVTVALIIGFSSGVFPEDIFPPIGNIGTEYPGDSGMIIPGGGDEIAEVDVQADVQAEPVEPVEAEIRASSESADEVLSEIQTEIKIDIETEDNKMGDIMVSFWHGVAAVLIGETAAIMVAIAYLKIRLANTEK